MEATNIINGTVTEQSKTTGYGILPIIKADRIPTRGDYNLGVIDIKERLKLDRAVIFDNGEWHGWVWLECSNGLAMVFIKILNAQSLYEMGYTDLMGGIEHK